MFIVAHFQMDLIGMLSMKTRRWYTHPITEWKVLCTIFKYSNYFSCASFEEKIFSTHFPMCIVFVLTFQLNCNLWSKVWLCARARIWYQMLLLWVSNMILKVSHVAACLKGENLTLQLISTVDILSGINYEYLVSFTMSKIILRVQLFRRI